MDEANRIKDVYARRSHKDILYSMANPSHRAVIESLEHEMTSALRDVRLESARILDLGCGYGDWLKRFIDWGAKPQHLYGVDILESRIAAAKKTVPGARVSTGNAAQLSFPSDMFDVAFHMTMFSSILDPAIRTSVAREMIRTLKPSGRILWYDFFCNNPLNPDVVGIGRRDIERLFPDCKIALKRVTLAPPISRLTIRYSSLHRVLSALPFLRTHYFGTIMAL